MAAVNLSNQDYSNLNRLSFLLNDLVKIMGEESVNEIKLYDELFTARAADIQAKRRQTSTVKSEIEKFL